MASPKPLTYSESIQSSESAVFDLAMVTSAPGGLTEHDGLQGPPVGRGPPVSPQPEPLSHFQNTINFSGSSGRRFKACRTCRRHKLKCERGDDGTCQRCRDSGVRCVYDTIVSRKRDLASKRGEWGMRSRPGRSSPDPKSPLAHARPGAMQTVTTSTTPTISSAHSPLSSHNIAAGRNTNNAASPPAQVVDASLPRRPSAQPSELTSEDLRAPVSAFNNMSRYQDSVRRQPKTPSSTGYNAEQQSVPSLGLLFGRDTNQEDMVSKGIISQGFARQLFNNFMTGAGVFLPIFDPILDSFETLRLREPFCFAVILTLASCIDGSDNREQCLSEVKELLARTLFHNPASLGKVQGMLLLIVYAESTWFAIGHALQMAVDLGLDRDFSHEHSMPRYGSPFSHLAGGQREAIRRARVWLALCFIEREIAIGTARLSRIPKVPAADLLHFTCQSQAHPPNMRLASLVEAVQIRDEFFSAIATADDLEDNGLHRLRSMQSRFEEWLKHWETLHEDCGYDVSSFQRVSLHGQKHYAMIFLGCATIGRISHNQQLSVAIKDRSGPLSDIVEFVMAIAMKQLRHVSRSDSYKWHLKWATNYTIFSLAFTGIFALEISRHREGQNNGEIFNAVSEISEILADHHDPFFHHLVEVRLLRHPGAPPQLPVESAEPTNLGHPSPNSSSAPRISVHAAARDDVRFEPPVEEIRDPIATGVGLDSVYHNTLNQFLETPDWMMNPSSMLVFDQNNWQNNDAFPNGC